jgi:hypothetical protein
MRVTTPKINGRTFGFKVIASGGFTPGGYTQSLGHNLPYSNRVPDLPVLGNSLGNVLIDQTRIENKPEPSNTGILYCRVCNGDQAENRCWLRTSQHSEYRSTG